MTPQEYKNLTRTIVPALQERLCGTEDKVIVELLQDTIDHQFNMLQPQLPPSLIIGIGYEGVGMMEAYQVTNSDGICEYKFIGNVQV